MSMLDERTRKQLKQALEPVRNELEMLVYTGGQLVIPGRDATGEQQATLTLLREISSINDRISVTEKPLLGDEAAAALGITLAPTLLLREAGSERSNIRFVGFPGGYEFSTLISTLIMLGTGENSLSPSALKQLEEVTTPVRVQTFVTPGCPHCPRAVLTAYGFAYHNPNITAEGIEASEFPLLSQRNRISSVPDTIIRGEQETRVLGAQPDRVFVEAVLSVTKGQDAASA